MGQKKQDIYIRSSIRRLSHAAAWLKNRLRRGCKQ